MSSSSETAESLAVMATKTAKRRRVAPAVAPVKRKNGASTTPEAAKKAYGSSPSRALTSLPADLKGKVAAFLTAREALDLSETCKVVRKDCSFSVLAPRSPLLSNKTFYGGVHDDTERRGPAVPVFYVGRTHSVTLCVRWRDQGWGNKKGELWVLGHPKTDDEPSFSAGRQVAKSPIADHHWTSTFLSFFPRDDEVYRLWYKCGGGGGHELHLENVAPRYLIYDHGNRGRANAFSVLDERGLLLSRNNSDNRSFCLGLVSAVAKSLGAQLKRNETPDPILSENLQGQGLLINVESLEALQMLASDINDSEDVEEEAEEDSDDDDSDGDAGFIV